MADPTHAWSRAPFAAVVAGAILAVPALRLTGPYFGLVTLVAVLLLQNVLVLFAGVTGGEIGLDLPDVLSIDDNTNYYYALVFMTVSGAILFGLSQSPVGLILQASGQDAVEAAALGFNVTKHKLAAFCISAFFSGLAGAMLIFYLGTASVGTVVDIAVGVNVIIAAVLGGRRTIIGAAVGAVFLIGAGEILRPAWSVVHLCRFRRRPGGDPVLPRRLHGTAAAVGRPRMTTLLEVEGLTKRFGGLVAVKDIGFSIDAGRDPRPDRAQWLRQIHRDEMHHGD